MIFLQATVTDTITRFFVHCGSWPSWVGHVFTLYAVLLCFAVYHDLYAQIRREKGKRCDDWLPRWFTAEPCDRKHQGDNSGNSDEHVFRPNETKMSHRYRERTWLEGKAP